LRVDSIVARAGGRDSRFTDAGSTRVWLAEMEAKEGDRPLPIAQDLALARDAVIRLLQEVGAHGHTLFEVQGFGATGERTAEIRELANIQVEVIVPPEVCERLMDRLEREFFPTYASVAYEADIRVRRPGKF